MWNAPATCSAITRVPRGAFSESVCRPGPVAGGDDLAAAVEVRRLQPRGFDGREHVGLLAADDGAHARVGLGRGLSHGASARADEPHAVDVADHARGHERRDLAHGMAGDAAEGGALIVGERLPREDARRDDQWLRDGCVADAVGVPFGAGGDEIDIGGRRVALEALTRTVELEPGGEETGGLRPLSGESGDNHSIYSSVRVG